MAQIIKVIAKTFEILEILNNEPNLSLKEITNKVSYPKPTVFRLLNTLSTLGYIVHDNDSQTFSISPKFIFFYKGAMTGNEIIASSQSYMEELHNKFNETINLVRLVDRSTVYVNILESDQLFKISNNIGDRASLHSTAVGKAILAFLPESKVDKILKNYSFNRFTKKTITNISELKKEIAKVKKQGFAIDNEEGHDGVFCVAAPIFDKKHNAIAAISISMPKVRAKKTVLDKIKKELPQITKKISSKLSGNNILSQNR